MATLPLCTMEASVIHERDGCHIEGFGAMLSMLKICFFHIGHDRRVFKRALARWDTAHVKVPEGRGRRGGRVRLRRVMGGVAITTYEKREACAFLRVG